MLLKGHGYAGEPGMLYTGYRSYAVASCIPLPWRFALLSPPAAGCLNPGHRFCIQTMSAIHAPARIGALWQQRMETMREYEVVRDGNVFGTSFSNSVVFSSDYEEARHQLDVLVAKYRNVPFD
ncbi:MAG: hypothetical protein MUO61_06415, partial [Dehalococcoidia bacterium]|nr:hypothetical protein [Dehalococcoidia bacterium]